MSPYDVNTGAWLGDEPAGTAERTDLADGAAPPESDPGPDPRQVARDIFDARMAAGMTREDAARDSFAALARAALAGDERVIYQEPQWTVGGQPVS